jgi:hypothetical protein
MSFASYAAQELSQLADRLAAAAAAEIDAATSRIEAELQPTIDGLQAEQARLVEDAARQHAEYERLQAERDALHDALEQVRLQGEQLRAESDTLRAESGRLRADRDALRASATERQAERDELQRALERVQAELESLQAEYAESVSAKAEFAEAHAAAELALQETRSLLDAARADALRLSDEAAQRAAAGTRLEAELAEARSAAHAASDHAGALLETARADAHRAREEAAQQAAAKALVEAELAEIRSVADAAGEDLRHHLDAARADVLRLSAELEGHAADNARLAAELEQARQSDRSGLVDRLQSVLDQIVASRSVDAVMSAVADGLASDFSRVAVFTINDNRLEPTHQVGFDANSGIGKVLIPLSVDSIITHAAAADAALAISPDDVTDAGGPPFGGSPSCIVTAPIKVRGEVLAVIYADDSGREAAGRDEERVKLTDVLRQCAVLRLERLTIELKTIAELRAYAKMLLDEVEYVYAADAKAGKPDEERQSRLQENLRCARQIYQQRVTLEGPAAATLLEEQIASACDAKASTPYGRDLALIAARFELDELAGGAAAQAS